MWVEMRHPVSASPSPNLFVPLRRRELKYLAKAAPWTAAPVRLPKETWIEISIYLRWQWNFMFVSLRRRELKWHPIFVCNTLVWFVPLRRRELKLLCICTLRLAVLVHLLAETWVEMYRAILLALDHHSSSPCGDVNWNGRIPCPYAVLSDRSFPRGDVSWNCSVFAQAKLDKSSSPKGDVNWNLTD